MKDEILKAIKTLKNDLLVSKDVLSEWQTGYRDEYNTDSNEREEQFQERQQEVKALELALTALQEQLERLENKQVTCEECKYHCDRDGKHRCVRLHICPEYSDFYCSFGELK